MVSRSYGFPTFVVLFTLLLGSGSLFGQSLYGSGIPAQAALVRCVELDGTAQNLFLGSTIIPAQGEGSVSSYFPVAPGMYFLQAGASEAEFIPQSGVYYTVLLSSQEIVILEDQAHDDPIRSQIYLYNLSSSESCSLQASGQVILEDTPSMASRQVVINPVGIPFTLVASGKEIFLESLPLSRGGSVSLFFSEKGEVIVVQAHVELQS